MPNRQFQSTEGLLHASLVISCYSDNLCVCVFNMYVFNSGDDYAERRKLVIQESKYLGGDMEHTHLVKGLDYALLEKVSISNSFLWRPCVIGGHYIFAL